MAAPVSSITIPLTVPAGDCAEHGRMKEPEMSRVTTNKNPRSRTVPSGSEGIAPHCKGLCDWLMVLSQNVAVWKTRREFTATATGDWDSREGKQIARACRSDAGCRHSARP